MAMELPRKRIVRKGKQARKVVPPEAIRPDPPQYRGTFVGQTVYAKMRRPTGKCRIVETEGAPPPRKDGTPRRHADGSPQTTTVQRYPVMQTEYDAVWCWDGRRWVRDYRANAGVGDGPTSNGTRETPDGMPGCMSAVRGECLSDVKAVGRQHPDRKRRNRRK